jgi:hypothetical protein
MKKLFDLSCPEEVRWRDAPIVLPMLPASARATAAKALVCFFCIMLFVKSPPWGREKHHELQSFGRFCVLVPRNA